MTTRVQGTVAEFDRGTALTRETLNPLPRAINSLLSGTAPPTQSAAPGARQTRTARFRIVGNAADHLTCYRLGADEAIATEVVKVAKPYLLRNSLATRAEITYTYTGTDARTADNGAETESQVVVPSWTAGDEILADTNIIGGTGVSVDDVALVWEARAGGRAWAKVAD